MKALKWILLGYLLLQLSLLTWCSFGLDKSLSQTLVSWDAIRYIHISFHSYTSEMLYAFFPLWPIFLHLFIAMGITEVYLPLYSALLSTFLYFVVLWNLGEKGEGFFQHKMSIFSMLFVTFCPGSWVFFTPHTEALFLFLSFFSFFYASKNKIGYASILAGFAGLTRNQGLFVMIAISLFAFLNESSGSYRQRFYSFLKSAFCSGILYASWLLYLYIKTGNALTSVHAQEYWAASQPTRAINIATYFRNVFWLSSSQIFRFLLFWTGLGIGLRLLFKLSPLEKSFGLYLVLSVLVWPLQGNNFPNVYRFSSVLFPIWIIMGNTINHYISTLINGKNYRILVQSLVLALWIICVIINGTKYYQGLWAY